MKLVSRKDALLNNKPSGPDQPDSLPSLDTLQVTAGPMLCRLQVWTEQEWADLAEQDRPVEFVHAPGLGWVGAVPIICMN
jgi:hypothetical protein